MVPNPIHPRQANYSPNPTNYLFFSIFPPTNFRPLTSPPYLLPSSFLPRPPAPISSRSPPSLRSPLKFALPPSSRPNWSALFPSPPPDPSPLAPSNSAHTSRQDNNPLYNKILPHPIHHNTTMSDYALQHLPKQKRDELEIITDTVLMCISKSIFTRKNAVQAPQSMTQKNLTLAALQKNPGRTNDSPFRLLRPWC